MVSKVAKASPARAALDARALACLHACSLSPLAEVAARLSRMTSELGSS
jgi:hypothetical protein